MEMHQIRYFLALSETLNFTHAAARCNVTQPALTRAIHALEAELGGELLRRERTLSHLTELGQRMLPLMRQCYESALAVQSMANSISKGESAPVSIAVSQTVTLALLSSMLREMMRAFPGLQLKLLRGSSSKVIEWLKSGEVEVAVAGPLQESWSRLDAYQLFDEPFDLFVARTHKLAGKNMADAADLASETLLINTDCELAEVLGDRLKAIGVDMTRQHRVTTQHDLLALVEASLGVAILPVGGTGSSVVMRVPLAGLDLGRKVSVYCAAGRHRSHASTTLLNLLRANDWDSYVPAERSWGIH